jgi:hypothetical protein
MLVLKLDTQIPLAEPTASFGFINWLDISIREFDSSNPAPVGHARVAVLLCGEALNHGESMHEVLEEDSEGLGVLDGIFFEDGSLKDDYGNGVGSDLLYFDDLELRVDWHGRNVEEAVVRRVLDAWGQGCAIGVMPVKNADEASRWKRIGFVVAQEPSPTEQGYLYMDLSLKQPRVAQSDDEGHAFSIDADDLI